MIASQYNRQIERTLKESPSFFLYFNNGITAITQHPPRKINGTAKQISLTGLQVVNGAQTVYSIYQAYKNAKNGEKTTINSNALIRFTLIQGGNRDFELDIARYTNQQNPTEPRDFWAYDEVQMRLQNESFKTNYWFEIRRDEFRETPNHEVEIVPNEVFAKAYSNFVLKRHNNTNMLFISSEKGSRGLYETVFNDDTTFEDMLLAYKMSQLLAQEILSTDSDNLVIMRILLEKLYPTHFNAQVNLLLKENPQRLVKLGAFIGIERQNIDKKNNALEIEIYTFEKLKGYFERLLFSLQDLEA